MPELNGSIKPYLTCSAASHAALILVLGIVLPNGAAAPEKVYRIDFIGATGGIINRSGTPARPKARGEKAAPKPVTLKAPLPKRVAPQKDPDAFNLKARKPLAPLPRPSLLARPAPSAEKPEPEMIAAAPPPVEPAEAPAPAEEAEVPSAASGEAAADAGDDEPGALVSADMPDFPHPWYLTRLRASLWDRWSARMPPGPAECGAVFSIMRSGRVVDLRIEFTSGDRGYDYAALSAVRDSAPFPPLPGGFREKFLKVHVQFRSR
ncbi:MAG: TonB family protein [Elusimicrobiota bacterium]